MRTVVHAFDPICHHLPRDRKRRVRELPPRILDVVQNRVPRPSVLSLEDANVWVQLMLAHEQKVLEKQRRHFVVGRHEVVPLLLQPLPQGYSFRLLVAHVAVQNRADDVVTRDVQLFASGGGLGMSLLLLLLL